MKEALEYCLARAWPELGFVVWAGVGYGSELELIRGVGAKNLLLLEPHHELHDRLARRMDDGDQEVLLPVALWQETGRHRFHQLNDPLRSTLLDPGQQLAGRPNLRVDSEVEVDTRSLDDLVRESGCQGDGLLVLDVCGAEPAIIQGASEACLQRFIAVVLRGPGHGSTGEDDAARLLRQRGFTSSRSSPGSHRSCLLLSRDPDTELVGNDPMHHTEGEAGNVERVQKRGHRESRNDAALSERSVHETRIAELEAELIEQTAERNAALARQQALEEDVATLTAQRDAHVRQGAAWEAERDRANADLAEWRAEARKLEAVLNEQAAERNAALARHQSLEEDVATLTAERDAHMRQGAAWEAERDRANADLAELRAEARKLEAELTETRQGLSLSVKLQSQYQADLRELQERYRVAQSVLERQRALLARLGERLGAAAKYFHELADQRSPDADSAESEHADEQSVMTVADVRGEDSRGSAAQRPTARKSRGKGPAKPRKR